MRRTSMRTFPLAGVLLAAMLVFGCGSGSSGSQSQNNGNSNSASNVQPISVNGGPASNYVDGAFTSVTVCVPGSSSNCQTISGVLVDTGSFGLRLLSGLSISLPPQTDSSGNPIAECTPFADGETWGSVNTADVKIAGETASSMPVQLIGSSTVPEGLNIPSGCTGQGSLMDTLADLNANGILGVGQQVPDCGQACASTTQNAGWYYSCPASGCAITTESVALQVQNPVASFASDNNGVIVELPSLSSVAGTLSGSLIFGIGTQSNNGLGSATVFGTDDAGDFTTTYQNVPYFSFLDSGSNAIYFLDSTTTGITECPEQNINFLYCPSSDENVSVVNTAEAGTNGASGSASFTVGNGLSLLSMGNNAAINGLAGPGTAMFPFDLGLPFFFGRKVYVGIVGKTTPGGTGPFTAY